MKTPRCSLALPLFAALVLAGCSTSVPLSGLNVAIVAFHPADAAHPENGGTLDLQVENESVVALGISHSVHKLYLNGTLAGTAVGTTPLGIPPMAVANEETTVHFNNPALIRQIAAGDSPVVHYRLESVLYQTINEDRYDMKAVSEGTVDLRGSPAPAK